MSNFAPASHSYFRGVNVKGFTRPPPPLAACAPPLLPQQLFLLHVNPSEGAEGPLEGGGGDPLYIHISGCACKAGLGPAVEFRPKIRQTLIPNPLNLTPQSCWVRALRVEVRDGWGVDPLWVWNLLYRPAEPAKCRGLGVWGLGFEVLGLGSRVPGSGFCVPGFRFQFPGSDLRFPISGFRVPVSDFQVSVSGFRVPVSGFQFPGSSFRVLISHSQVLRFGFRVTSRRFPTRWIETDSSGTLFRPACFRFIQPLLPVHSATVGFVDLYQASPVFRPCLIRVSSATVSGLFNDSRIRSFVPGVAGFQAMPACGLFSLSAANGVLSHMVKPKPSSISHAYSPPPPQTSILKARTHQDWGVRFGGLEIGGCHIFEMN